MFFGYICTVIYKCREKQTPRIEYKYHTDEKLANKKRITISAKLFTLETKPMHIEAKFDL